MAAKTASSNHVIVVGGGLAGSFMAANLALAGKRVTIFDDQGPGAASRVAAGLFNVITGRFGALNWRAGQLLAELQHFLQQPQFSSLRKWVHYTPIYRPFKAVEEYNKWTGRVGEPQFKPFARLQERPVEPERLHNHLGGIWIDQCGWVDIGGFISALHRILASEFGVVLKKQHLSYAEIHPEDAVIGSEKSRFEHIVFCEGFRGVDNPFFAGLGIIPNKGQVLEIEAPELQLDFVLSRKIYLVPAGSDRYVVGATYQNQFVDLEPDESAEAQIKAHLEAAIKVPFRVLNRQAGVRPTTKDRKGIAGTHPQFSHVHTLTGLGTKGVLQAPFLSRLLTRKIVNGVDEIPPEVNLNRFNL